MSGGYAAHGRVTLIVLEGTDGSGKVHPVCPAEGQRLAAQAGVPFQKPAFPQYERAVLRADPDVSGR